MVKQVERKCDMGSGMKLSLLVEDDGDVLVSVMPQDHVFTHACAEFCMSGTQSRRTGRALHDLIKAMEQDEAEIPQNLNSE